MRSPASILHLYLYLFSEAADAHHRAAYSAPANFLRLIAGGHAQSVEAFVESLEHGIRFDAGTDTAGGSMLNVDRSPHRSLVALAILMQRMECGRLHQPDHVRSRVNRRKFGMLRRQRVLELNGFL